MKSLSIVGIILLIISSGFFYFSNTVIEISHLMSIIGGIGIGLFFGGIVGYISKGTAIKEAEKNKQIEKLQSEKYELQQKINQQNTEVK